MSIPNKQKIISANNLIIAEKLARLEAQSRVNTDAALERILNGGA